MLSDIIAGKITADGPMNFHDFMDMALYYPDHGYYAAPAGDKTGGNYTCPPLDTAIGHMVARQIDEMWTISGLSEFTIVEYGAGTSLLCCDILNYFKNTSRYDKLQYAIIGNSLISNQVRQGYERKISLYRSIKDIPAITGCIISNELVGNLPAHQVVMQDELMELFVDYNNCGFVEVLRPASPKLKNYLAAQNITLPQGYRTQINLEALNWITEAAHALKKGYLMTIDYGYTAAELYNTRRNIGTLVCYHKDITNRDPYSCIGQQDITTYVNFSALYRQGEQCGLQHCGFTQRGHFLSSLGIMEYLQSTIPAGTSLFERAKQINHLQHMFLMETGEQSKVLIQSKGIDDINLKGMQHTLSL